jgi:hypothetical protein
VGEEDQEGGREREVGESVRVRLTTRERERGGICRREREER